MIIPFSNSWLYGSTTPNLTLMGTPANILLWSRKSRPATVKVRLVAPTRKCSVRISVNNHELVCIQLAPSEPPGQLTEKEFSFNVNKGLNYFTFIPEIDPLERVERASFIHAVRAKGVAAGRDAIELADFAEHGATPVDPRNLGLYQKWNLLRPPMYQRGFVPYVIMESMKVHLH
jgi:hypothetical protein